MRPSPGREEWPADGTTPMERSTSGEAANMEVALLLGVYNADLDPGRRAAEAVVRFMAEVCGSWR